MGVALLDFGSNNGDTASVTVAATFLTSSSRITCNHSYVATSDHDSEDSLYEELDFEAVNVVPGVSFDILAHSSSGTFGKYNVSWIAR